MTTFVLRIREPDKTYSVGALDLPSNTTIEDAIRIAIDDLGPGRRIERITAASSKASLTLQSITRPRAQGFGS